MKPPASPYQIRRIAPEEWRAYRDVRLRALEDAPEAFGATLAENLARSDTEWQERLASAVDPRWNLPLTIETGGKLVGLAWGRIDETHPEAAYLYQMWVAPQARGRGLGRKMLQTVIDWAQAQGAHTLHLGVTERDSPAMHLYQTAGFEPAGQAESLRPGSELMCLPMQLSLIG